MVVGRLKHAGEDSEPRGTPRRTCREEPAEVFTPGQDPSQRDGCHQDLTGLLEFWSGQVPVRGRNVDLEF